ncbi:MAG TPA: hypothetical protein VNT50_11510, partial [Microbacterium sp.]|nr:hypothetical protein [Microbacterium sp.]
RGGDAPSPTGAWWLTDAGCPVFVHAESGDAAEAGARRILEEMASGCGDRHLNRLLGAAIAALDKPRSLASGVGRLEAELFDACAAQPLATAVFPSARARDLDAPALRPFAPDDPPAGAARPFRDAIARHVDGELADIVSVAIGGAVRSLRSRLGRGRRAPWIAAAGVAGAIVLGGALWPTGDGSEPVAHAADPSPAASTPVPAGSDSPAPSTTDAPNAASLPLDGEAGILLDRLAECRSGSDPSCLDAVLEVPSLEPPPGAIDLDRTARTITPLDDYGGVAVLRVEALAGDAAPQLIVIVRANDRWLLRDVYDVAEQPSA